MSEPAKAPESGVPHDDSGLPALTARRLADLAEIKAERDNARRGDEPTLLARWVDSLWITLCPHAGGYARDCIRCTQETLYGSDWMAEHDLRIVDAAMAEVERRIRDDSRIRPSARNLAARTIREYAELTRRA